MEYVSDGETQPRLKISWIYADVDDSEGETFRAAHEGMRGGWSGSLDGLGAFLARNS